MGESTQVEAIAPGLTAQRWQEGEHTVLIYGGSASAAPDTTLLTSLKRLRHFRPLGRHYLAADGKTMLQTAQLDKGWRELATCGQLLGFQAPLYLWQVCDGGGYQAGRTLQSVGCLLPEHCVPEQLASQLEARTLQLTAQGVQQLLNNDHHDSCYGLPISSLKAVLLNGRRR
ncbi:ImcF domain-containing protein [Klebsiella pneumoniae]|uniref:ImcF domain-containing protein n=1 Tax=Klebsiella pneumoniae TaxID=573 RepID=A0A377V943_KLEPN|nr:ImcF domain-containing protein [Klebsiella pneumoniae]